MKPQNAPAHMKSSMEGEWLTEWFTTAENHSHKIRRILVSKRTKFQNAIVADASSFGRCLVLDGEMQSAQLDEFIYHECLVHPGMLAHPNPREVLVMGGGEGATVREILKYKSVRLATMVDLDGEVVDFCKKHLVQWHRGCFKDKRTRLIIDDAKKFIEQSDKKFDVIISDLPSPIEAGPAWTLYTIEFYKTLLKRLTPDGVFAIQAGSGNLLQIQLHRVLYRTLRRIFPIVRAYYAYVPSFDVPWAFCVCTRRASQDPARITQAQIDRMLRSRTRGAFKFYDGYAHEGLMKIPLHYRNLLHTEKRVITIKKPVFFFK